jgi:membrane protease YdiL (CAAX protease family)
LGRVAEEAPPDVRDAAREPRRLLGWIVYVSILTLIGWAGRLSSGPPDPNAAYTWELGVGATVQFAIMLAVIAYIARGAWSLLALRRPRNWGRAIGVGIGVLLAVDLLAVALSPFLDPGEEQGLTPTEWEPSQAAPFALFAFSVVVLAPLAEELTFRGLGYSLLRPYGPGLFPPIVGTALIWSFAHGLLEAIPIITALGIGLGWIRYRQDSTIPGMILHGSFNAIALAVALAS